MAASSSVPISQRIDQTTDYGFITQLTGDSGYQSQRPEDAKCPQSFDVEAVFHQRRQRRAHTPNRAGNSAISHNAVQTALNNINGYENGVNDAHPMTTMVKSNKFHEFLK